MVSVGARVNANQVLREMRYQRCRLFTAYLRFNQNSLAVLIYPMYRKDVLGEINPASHNAHGLSLLWFQMDDFDITMSALRCHADFPLLPRDGKVPFIH